MKRSRHSLWLCVAIAVIVASIASAQQPQMQDSQAPPIKARTEEVLLDVVVRDKKGRLTNDLKAEDFQILDNGQPKKISAFRLVQGKEAVALGTRTTLDPLRQVRLVTLIFQCWGNDARRLARDSALDLLKGELPQNVYMSVMTIDHKLQVLQSFTNDPELIRKAVERATHSQGADFSGDTARVQKELEDLLGPKTSGEQSSEQQLAVQSAALSSQAMSPAHNPDGSSFASLAMAQMVLSMIQTERDTAMQESGRADIFSLLDCVKEQYRLPGRKTILYFREGGFPIPQGMEEPFRSVISIANRSNVSFYAVDARGLTTSNMNTGVRDVLASAAQATQQQARDTGTESSVNQERERSKIFDTAIESTRSNTQTSLFDLATSTGGLLIANTNDLKSPLKKLAEDIETYYEISYSPEIQNYDGSFHKISVKLDAAELRIQSRSGYFALPPNMGAAAASLRPYEAVLLGAISAATPRQEFPMQVAGLHFLGRKNQPVAIVALDVPFENLTFAPKSGDQYEGHLSYVALLKNSKGEVIKKFQNEIPITISAAKLQALKSSHFLYTEHFDLPSGDYLLEAAVLDGAANPNRVSSRKANLVIPAAALAPAISSVTFVRNTKEKDAATTPDNPLLFGSKVISPDLHPTIKKGTDGNLSFYLVGWAEVGSPAKLIMEFSKDGQVLGQASPDIGQPDKQGRIQYVGSIPTGNLPAGEWGIRFVLQQASKSAEEKAQFTVN